VQQQRHIPHTLDIEQRGDSWQLVLRRPGGADQDADQDRAEQGCGRKGNGDDQPLLNLVAMRPDRHHWKV